MAASEYNPKPVNTSGIELPEDLQAQVEALARNNHEVWARARIAEGWKYGAARNDARKEHPGMVPYDQLSESEKDIDRGTVLQTLKAAIAMGCDVSTRGRQVDGEHSADDMLLWPEWPQGLAPDVVQKLGETRKEMRDGYQTADGKALSRLFWHRLASRLTAVLGTVAVLLAVWQLYDPVERKFPEWLEFGSVVCALIAVVVGVWAALMKGWLVQRHRAERLRFLKFQFLLRVALAERDRESLLRCAREFSHEARDVSVLDDALMEQWLEEEQVLNDPPSVRDANIVLADLQVLAEHYKLKRLKIQSNYFFKQMSRNTRWDWQTKNIPPLVFLGSIFFAMAHFMVSYRFHEQYREASRLLILLAAGLPVLGAGVRALRANSEYSRNVLRFRAKYEALDRLIGDLEKELSAKPAAERLVRYLWKGEQILEGEHREWLRLMIETEWIG